MPSGEVSLRFLGGFFINTLERLGACMPQAFGTQGPTQYFLKSSVSLADKGAFSAGEGAQRGGDWAAKAVLGQRLQQFSPTTISRVE